jgi:N-acetylglucosaminyldiphosphoundecaprenol N-acetyl-beta-D-mannosaminyltransferase
VNKERFLFFGARVAALNQRDLTAALELFIRQGGKHIVSNLNLRALYLLDRDQSMRELIATSDLVHIDGMPLIWIAQILGHSVSREHRITYVDWFPMICAQAEASNRRVFYLGSSAKSLALGLQNIQKRFPALNIAGHHGHLQTPEDQSHVIEMINAFQPHILMVGMGMPLQENWIIKNKAVVHANVFLASGAAMDYVAGVVRTPPRWLGLIGLEWAYRLVCEPRRLWRRYLWEPMFLVAPVLSEIWSVRVRHRRRATLTLDA